MFRFRRQLLPYSNINLSSVSHPNPNPKRGVPTPVPPHGYAEEKAVAGNCKLNVKQSKQKRQFYQLSEKQEASLEFRGAERPFIDRRSWQL